MLARSICIFYLVIVGGPTFCINYRITPEDPVPGSVVVLEQESKNQIRGCILEHDEQEYRYEGKALRDAHGKNVFLLPLSHTIEPGLYQLSVEFEDGSAASLPLKISMRDFIYEDIPLNRSMTGLRQEDSEAKRQESAELWNLLGTMDLSLPYRALDFIKPVEAIRTTSFYGDRRRYLYADGGISETYHNGIDYAVLVGTPVYAVESGTVVLAKNRIMTGYTVVLEHMPGVFTLYYHLDRLDVQQGDIVKKNTRIGKSGATGLATGPHLHFEMRVFQVPVDPECYMHSISSKESLN